MTLPAMTNLLHLRDEMLVYMEEDLVDKCRLALVNNEIKARVAGVFSLDDLEDKESAELEGKIAVGVGYHSAQAIDGKVHAGPAGVSIVEYNFMVLLAVPTEGGSDIADKQRYSATRLLSILRRGVAGKIVAGDRASRTWTFVSEAPRIPESTDSVQYYSQVWRLVLPNSPAN